MKIKLSAREQRAASRDHAKNLSRIEKSKQIRKDSKKKTKDQSKQKSPIIKEEDSEQVHSNEDSYILRSKSSKGANDGHGQEIPLSQIMEQKKIRAMSGQQQVKEL